MIIKVLGPGCGNCKRLESNVAAALAESGVDATVEKVTDYAEIAGYGIASTPGLVIDDTVVMSGRVATVAEIFALLDATSQA
ncbi:MAG: redox-active disulfide protein 2 [Actinobacteria bacterium HGW-Actinobacteria-4]|nr:MAG: redox-active disulfide protein 2 [Actinobacteria bacterium HGW-Actinobacteria-4]